MFELHVAHIHVHKGGTGKKMFAFRRNKGDFVVGFFSDMSCGGNPRNAISDYDDMFHWILGFMGNPSLLSNLKVRTYLKWSIRNRFNWNINGCNCKYIIFRIGPGTGLSK